MIKARHLILGMMLAPAASLLSQTDTSAFLAPLFGISAPDFSTCNPASNLNQFYYATSSAPFARFQCKVGGWTRQGSAESPLSFMAVPVPLGFVGTFYLQGRGTVNAGTVGQLAYYAASGTAVSGSANLSTEANNVPSNWLSDTGPTQSVLSIIQSSTSPAGLVSLFIGGDWSPSSNVDPDFFANYGLGLNTSINADGQATDNLYQAGISAQIINNSNTRHVSVIDGVGITSINANGGALDELNGVSPYVTNDGSGFVQGMNGEKNMVLNTGPGHVEFMEGYYSRMSVLAGSVLNAWAYDSTGDDSVMSGGTITNYVAFHYSTPHPTGTVITNNYGIYLEAAAHAVNNWQIFSAGTAPSFFAGPMQAFNFQETLTTPASSSAACSAGQFTDDASFHYVCTATNTWKRVALSTF